MSATWPLHVALIERLKGTAGVTALVAQRIYDGRAAQGAVMPYIVVGEQTTFGGSTFGRAGTRETTNVNVFSSYPGMKEAMAIGAQVELALATPLTVTGWGTVKLRFDAQFPLVEDDGTRHVSIRLRALTAAAS